MESPIIVVTGLPRSGTSLMMQILAAAGVPIVADAHRPADESNPRGYFEDARVKSLARDATWLGEARGRAVKIVAPLVPFLPSGLPYRVLFMQRDLGATLRSQEAMLQRSGTGIVLNLASATKAAEVQIAAAKELLHRLPETAVKEVDFHELMKDPTRLCNEIQWFLGIEPTSLAAMIGAVDPHLERNRPAAIQVRGEVL